MQAVLFAVTRCLGSAVLSIGLLTLAPAYATTISGQPNVVDGDGLSFGPIAIRLHGIDAPSGSRVAGIDFDRAVAKNEEHLIGFTLAFRPHPG